MKKTLLLSFIALFLAACTTTEQTAEINSYEECAAAGNAIMESYPEQCSADGKTFTRILTDEEKESIKQEDSNIPKNCTSWFDGCNNCKVMPDGGLACTKKLCQENKEPKCTKFKE